MKAQSFKKGDILFNVNYGQPNAAAFYQKTLYQKRLSVYYNGDYTQNYSNTGVLSLKCLYARSSKVEVGLGIGLWKYNTSEVYIYREHVMANYGSMHTASNKEEATFQALTLRLNRHFGNYKKIDPYVGFGLGVTRISYKEQHYSLDSGSPVLLADQIYPSDFLPTFALTFGLRYYPLYWFGLNFEAGYDAGALLSGGLIFKYASKNKGETK
ncbi:hypothetical protein CNR22_21310 [Sphingobacteriaceae bacterium]|nr:hypothetical protein CNR22_21310 [Sphingobacteriaceae bacterium]